MNESPGLLPLLTDLPTLVLQRAVLREMTTVNSDDISVCVVRYSRRGHIHTHRRNYLVLVVFRRNTANVLRSQMTRDTRNHPRPSTT